MSSEIYLVIHTDYDIYTDHGIYEVFGAATTEEDATEIANTLNTFLNKKYRGMGQYYTVDSHKIIDNPKLSAKELYEVQGYTWSYSE